MLRIRRKFTKNTVFCGWTESSASTQCSHEFALGFRFSQLSAARPLRHSAADAVQTGAVFFEVAGGREGEIEGHAVALVGQAGLRQGFAEAADGQGGRKYALVLTFKRAE